MTIGLRFPRRGECAGDVNAGGRAAQECSSSYRVLRLLNPFFVSLSDRSSARCVRGTGPLAL
jgi:hypothetical protein